MRGRLAALLARRPSAAASEEALGALRVARASAQFLGACFLVDQYALHLTITQGPSMMPTLHEMGDVVLVDRLSPRTRAGAIARGDIVVAESAYKRDFVVCKRVLALPGDVVAAARPPRQGLFEAVGGGGGGGGGFGGEGLADGGLVTVPPGHVWLEGDNPLDSVDSRYYGPVPAALIRGRAVARVWPPWAARRLDRDSAPRPVANTLLREAMLADAAIAAAAAEAVAARARAAAEAARLRGERLERERARLERERELLARARGIALQLAEAPR
jgi:inner membrane protease subunit 1